MALVAGYMMWKAEIEKANVIHAGTMNSNNATVAAALATIQVLEEQQPYDRMFSYGIKLMEGLRSAAAETGHDLLVQGMGPMFNISFTKVKKVKEYRYTFSADRTKLNAFIAGMHEKGVRIIGR
jgi:glutamate-1-semialdehyde 2,1-aminomutase